MPRRAVVLFAVLALAPVSRAELPGGEKGNPVPEKARRVEFDAHGAVLLADPASAIVSWTDADPAKPRFRVDRDVVISADAETPLESVVDFLSAASGTLHTPPGMSRGRMLCRFHAEFRTAEGGNAVIPIHLPTGDAPLPAAKRHLVLVCGTEKPYRAVVVDKPLHVIGCGGVFMGFKGLPYRVLRPTGKALDLDGLKKAVGDARDGKIVLVCGTGGKWKDLLAAHRALNPKGFIQLGGGAHNIFQHGEQYRDRNIHRLVPAGRAELEDWENTSRWALTVMVLPPGRIWIGNRPLGARKLTPVLKAEAEEAPRDEKGYTRRRLILIASRSVRWNVVARVLRTALADPVKFKSARLVLKGDKSLKAVTARPSGGKPVKADQGVRIYAVVALDLPKEFHLTE